MAGFESIALEKGMYTVPHKSFSRLLEEMDPSENYKGTALEGMDAYQRQLKRFDIRVGGVGSDPSGKVFSDFVFGCSLPGICEPGCAPGHGAGGRAPFYRSHGDENRRHGLSHHHFGSFRR